MNTDIKIRALVEHFNNEISEEKAEQLLDEGTFIVMTDGEAEQAARDSIEQYVEDCILPEMPEFARYYFDVERYTDDVLLSDGRGHVLNGWDGSEHEVKIDNKWYYIYQNENI